MSDNNANSAVILPKYPRVQAKLNPAGQAQYWTADEMVALHAVLAEKDATIDDLRAQLATVQRELAEARKTIAYRDVSRVSLTVSAEGRSDITALQAATPVGLNAPDGPGWWAFEGKSDDDEMEYKTVHLVLETRVGLIASRDNEFKLVTYWHGKWTRLHMPWEATPVAEDKVTVGQPDWDLCPWAEWAVVQIETNGPIHFHWSYFEYEPQPATGEGDGYYYHRKGKWRKDSREIPLGQFIDLESTLQRRPHAQQDSQGVSDE